MSDMQANIPFSAQMREVLGDIKGAAKEVAAELRQAERQFKQAEKEAAHAARGGATARDPETARLLAGERRAAEKRMNELSNKLSDLRSRQDVKTKTGGEASQGIADALRRMEDRASTAGRIARGQVGLGDIEALGEKGTELGKWLFDKGYTGAGLAAARAGQGAMKLAAFAAGPAALGLGAGMAMKALIDARTEDNKNLAEANKRRGNAQVALNAGLLKETGESAYSREELESRVSGQKKAIEEGEAAWQEQHWIQALYSKSGGAETGERRAAAEEVIRASNEMPVSEATRETMDWRKTMETLDNKNRARKKMGYSGKGYGLTKHSVAIALGDLATGKSFSEVIGGFINADVINNTIADTNQTYSELRGNATRKEISEITAQETAKQNQAAEAQRIAVRRQMSEKDDNRRRARDTQMLLSSLHADRMRRTTNWNNW